MNRLPLIEKVDKTNEVFIERVLPDLGQLLVKVGDKVEPFTKAGTASVSYFYVKIDPRFTLTKTLNSYIEKGVTIGERRKGLKKLTLIAPFNGFIRAVGDGSFVFEQDKQSHTLLSGLWGDVVGSVPSKSFVVKGSATRVYSAVSTPFEAEGELVVLPNPPEILQDPYFTKFTKDVSGKIIYAGYHVRLENIKRALKLGIRGVIAGGFDKESYDFGLQSGFTIAAISGYGSIPTPAYIYDLLKSVANRYVFIRGQTGEIIIPSDHVFEDAHSEKKDFFTEIKSGMIVQVLERPFFGWTGVITELTDGKVKVKLDNHSEEILVKPVNLIALA